MTTSPELFGEAPAPVGFGGLDVAAAMGGGSPSPMLGLGTLGAEFGDSAPAPALMLGAGATVEGPDAQAPAPMMLAALDVGGDAAPAPAPMASEARAAQIAVAAEAAVPSPRDDMIHDVGGAGERAVGVEGVAGSPGPMPMEQLLAMERGG